MNEAALKQALRDRLKGKRTVVLRLEDKFTAGIPDGYFARSTASTEFAFWCEVKIVERDANLRSPWKWKSFKLQQAVKGNEIDAAGGTEGVFFLAYCSTTRRCVLAPVWAILASAKDEQPLPDHYVFSGNGYEQLNQMLNQGRKAVFGR
jgi:hypothetical protein